MGSRKGRVRSRLKNLRELRIHVARLLDDEDAYVARSAQIGIEMFDINDRYPGERPESDDDEE